MSAGRIPLVAAMTALAVVLLAPSAFVPLLPVADRDPPVDCAIAGNPTPDVVHASALPPPTSLPPIPAVPPPTMPVRSRPTR